MIGYTWLGLDFFSNSLILLNTIQTTLFLLENVLHRYFGRFLSSPESVDLRLWPKYRHLSRKIVDIYLLSYLNFYYQLYVILNWSLAQRCVKHFTFQFWQTKCVLGNWFGKTYIWRLKMVWLNLPRTFSMSIFSIEHFCVFSGCFLSRYSTVYTLLERCTSTITDRTSSRKSHDKTLKPFRISERNDSDNSREYIAFV